MRVPGVVLTVIFYSVIVVLGVVLLAAVQLRSSGGATFDTWKLNYDANRILAARHEEALKATQKDALANVNDLSFTKSCLRLFDDSGIPQAKLIDSETAQEVKTAKQARTPYDKLDGDARCLVRGYTLLQHDKNFFAKRDTEYSAEIEELKKSLTSDSEQYADLIKGHQDFIAFRGMASVWYQKPFFESPYDLLVLLLVMMMGAVGGMVRLLRDYGAPHHPNPSANDYFFIPLIGAVVAIGGYVLAKTGLLLLSSTRGETSLSPYMISLVGIVSGLLAKEVIDTIAASGRNILKQNGRGLHQDTGGQENDVQPAGPKGGSRGQAEAAAVGDQRREAEAAATRGGASEVAVPHGEARQGIGGQTG